MRFLIDEDLPIALSERLCEIHHDAVDVRKAGLRGSSDLEVYGFAVAESRILITADVDLAGAIATSAVRPLLGCILVRLPNEYSGKEICARVRRAFEDLAESDIAGNIIVIEADRVRMRRGKPE